MTSLNDPSSPDLITKSRRRFLVAPDRPFLPRMLEQFSIELEYYLSALRSCFYGAALRRRPLRGAEAAGMHGAHVPPDF